MTEEEIEQLRENISMYAQQIENLSEQIENLREKKENLREKKENEEIKLHYATLKDAFKPLYDGFVTTDKPNYKKLYFLEQLNAVKDLPLIVVEKLALESLSVQRLQEISKTYKEKRGNIIQEFEKET